MRQPASTPQDRYDAIVEALLTEAGVTFGPPGSGFGSTALKTEGKIFAMLVGNALVVKLPRPRVEAIIAAGDGQPFDPGTGRIMKEWVAVTPTSKTPWLSLAQDARYFVAAQASSRSRHRSSA
jgi:hypothetical protein